MAGVARIDRDEVLLALRPSTVLEHFSVKGRRSGDEFRTKLCPACGPRAREAVAVNMNTGLWHDHTHGCKGDLLALLAALSSLDARTQFPEVLALAAELAGVDARELDVESRTRRRAELHQREQQRRHEDAVAEAERRADAIKRATTRWGELERRSEAGEAYLTSRGVGDSAKLGFVRFTRDSIAVALRTADGQVVNVVRRRIDVGEPKVLGMKGCPTAGTFIDSIADIAHGRDVVLVEGVFDALTARLAWPSAVVLGAHGASQLPTIAKPAARRVMFAKARLLLVPHGDDAGEQAMIAAGREAQRCGLTLGRTLAVLDTCGANDLNAAWQVAPDAVRHQLQSIPEISP